MSGLFNKSVIKKIKNSIITLETNVEHYCHPLNKVTHQGRLQMHLNTVEGKSPHTF